MKQLTDAAILALAADHKLPVRFPHEVIAFARDLMAQQVGVPEEFAGLRKLAAYPLEDFSRERSHADTKLFGANDWHLTVGDVLSARQMLAAAPAVVQAEVSAAYKLAVTIRTAQGWNIDGGPVPILYTDTINEQQVCRDDVFLCKTEHLARPDAQGKLDTERLDWLDKQGHAYGFEDMHEGNRWMIDGPFANLRVAIDAARGAE